MEGLIHSGLGKLGLTGSVPENSSILLARYGELLVIKNKVMNLTAITEPEDVASLHMLDCAALLNCVQLKGKSLIDVGTGAGFPGMVLKILTPSLKLTALDSQNKRLDWLMELCGNLSIQEVRAVHGRAEEAGLDPAFREQYDFATARAVADLRLLCELCLPFVKVGGHFLAMKGPDSGEEIQRALSAIETLGGRVERRYDYQIPHTNVTHCVILIEKTAHTPNKYPRRWTKIQKVPL